MKPVKNLNDAVLPMYLASVAIRIELTGSPLKRPVLLGLGFDLVLAKHMPLGNPRYLHLQRTGVHRV